MTSKMFWFWMVMNIIVIGVSIATGDWLLCAIYFAIGDPGQMISTYVERNYGE